MDISRPDIRKKKLRRQIIVLAIVAVGVTAAAWAVMRLKPAVPTVDASTIWPDTVKRGDFTRNVRGLGTLVPREESIELIPAQTEATVVRIRVLPGARVTPDTVLMDLEDPTLQQQLLNAELAVKQAEADYRSLNATLQSTLMDKKSTGAQINAQYSQAELQANTDKQLYALGVISGIQYNQSKNNADQLTSQHQISEEQLDVNQKAIAVQLASAQTKIDQAKAQLALYQSQEDALHVKAGISGVVESLPTPVSVGEHVAAGTSVAEVVDPTKLKAALQIAETQAHDILLGQAAEIDTHNGIVPGRVTRIDPSVLNGTRTVDVTLDGALPMGAVPGLSVDGTIELAHLHDVLYVGRPAFGNENSTISLFRIDPNGKTATRVQVQVGKASTTEIQILSGLNEGDRVILSDMSRYDATDKVRLE
ncbi:MAG TPA: HlyD family efflux transporter periplasmic adaptor subunit [Acidobacteriaceae bacterium]|nr:HlyD family efflux transporter periplasmic adaptor subunit [Acidobacteriaceae bacterium]HUB19776.1 HlyD family efflux transporter periplasmic adaptor subunit [Acidobacteriaceae bacterium]